MAHAYAPLKRARSTGYDLHHEYRLIDQIGYVTTLMDAIPSSAMILNEHRQILAVNRYLLRAFDIGDPAALLGRRPGEALDCIYHKDGPDGCGTGRNCCVCGTLLTILSRQETDQQASGECRLTLGNDRGTALDLEATASPLRVEGRNFTIIILRDISVEKRQQVMERIFFHDIINTAGGIRGLAALLLEEQEIKGEITPDYPALMVSLTDNLIDEIKHQRRLLAAERGDFKPVQEGVELGELLREVCTLYAYHERVPGRIIDLKECPPCRVRTDPTVLRRIVGNMLLNALEASDRGMTVEVAFEQNGTTVRIAVTNPGEIPVQVQLQIFQRSFSSKGTPGRGIGTYSMKLFGERYLGGQVGFTSRNGLTTFFIVLPTGNGNAASLSPSF
ncbi:HAMP domain-containing sensor histidine kinase [Geobacter sp. SVR]|uniref:sensor histidine kinase n=1 Tax=Geobacter sp. SVR TaxID=2495594 RepID=UPI00143F008B|nr:HAMP domain-containing sensor histidine kinase [Geobacter sp. SVR]BCS55770.1 sensor histidine kinase [Geobacter sp. SVR]GCF83774.1 sensor histidine kinase [Geobacter sp. SVR]